MLWDQPTYCHTAVCPHVEKYSIKHWTTNVLKVDVNTLGEVPRQENIYKS